ncbi:hypothetical protein E1218_26345 [Kribbella turkmenica]|uniref:Uncharacterized protein n=1 Tax=Kribbella turkmenica TaxID=2530375 RepID=A0A4R4WRJ9_9ACTN|nr:hypothetical protein [Kribbella turkmenica]TDD18280.1 hypothetical protein E1218_26345 [Kribbella turkmenica]
MTSGQEPAGDVRLGRVGKGLRILVAVAGIGLLVNGSVRATDDAWPFGPMSQYAMSVPDDASITYTRISAQTDAGTTVDVPLNIEGAGVARAEIEARTGEIVKDPSLLQQVADGWAEKHPDEPKYVKLALIRDTTQLVNGRVAGPPTPEVLATWEVRR